MFENLFSSRDCFSSQLKLGIWEHLQSLEVKFQKYFPDLAEKNKVFLRNPFSTLKDIRAIPDQVQNKWLDMKNDSSARDLFGEKLL